MSNLELAVFRCLRTLRRRAAGEHALSIGDCIWMWATEYGLDVPDMERMSEECMAYAEHIRG